MICADYCLEAVAAVCSAVPALKWLLVLETLEKPAAISVADVAGAESLREVLARSVATVDVRLLGPKDPLQIIYTSGTTGNPRGVVFQNARFGGFARLGALLGYRPDERPYTGLSLTHGNAQAVTLAPALSLRLHAVFSRRFTKSRLWDVAAGMSVTFLLTPITAML
jgi:crotonobetaine/carnitine-CoA ligase